MVQDTSAARNCFRWTFVVILLTVCCMYFSARFFLQRPQDMAAPLLSAAKELPEAASFVQSMELVNHRFRVFAPIAAFVFFGVLILLLRAAYRPLSAVEIVPGKKPPKASDAGSKEDPAEKKRRDQRLFLHLISILQREGRLIDFFAEDLTDFSDTQIGAAVREIHSTCRKVVEKSLSLKAVINQVEGEMVTVDPGFDPRSVKLIGNVTGEPPFSGVLRHRGWQAGKLDLPTLSGSQDPTIIAPAEVEIL